jgi:deoxycytidylate deaminase
MNTPLPTQAPELVFGLIAPIGVDLDLITNVFDDALREMEYEAREFRLTELMREVPVGLPLTAAPYVRSYKEPIAYANAVRSKLGNDGLAALAISAIRSYRAEERTRRSTSIVEKAAADSEADGRAEEEPLPRQAYIIRQLKRPEEVALLRSVYGRQFILVSAYAPQVWRQNRIEQRERESRGGLISDVEAHHFAHELVVQDAQEAQELYGQNVRDAFPLGDVFIDATSRSKCEEATGRFIRLLFGSNEITPTHDEYGMYMAKSASLRSSDLSRQVGAAIFRASGEVATLGCNEVPKAGGGTYWAGDTIDHRDFVQGFDPNERMKREVLVDVLDRLKKGKHLSVELSQIEDPHEIAKKLLSDESGHSLSDSRIMDLIEFGRIIHAEMSAIADAARKGVSIDGATLYCTTFPCHICAKHIVASGIRTVVYLEPYPKSYATDLQGDSISVDAEGTTAKVQFRAFLGVSPYRYRDLFEKGRRKYSGGSAQRWHKGERRPMIDVSYPQHFQAEAVVVGSLSTALGSVTK